MNPLSIPDATSLQLGYMLSKHLPSMLAGFTIQTNYGDIAIDADEAKPFVDLLEQLINRALPEVV